MLWTAKVKLSNSRLEDVSVQAADPVNAKALQERLYGRGTIVYGPMRPDPNWAKWESRGWLDAL